MVIFDRKSMNPDLAEGEVPGTTYGLSPNGWMDSELLFNVVCAAFSRLCASFKAIITFDGWTYEPFFTNICQ